MLDFEICESPGSKCAKADGHLSNSTAASNLSFLLKHQGGGGIGFPEAKALEGALIMNIILLLLLLSLLVFELFYLFNLLCNSLKFVYRNYFISFF